LFAAELGFHCIEEALNWIVIWRIPSIKDQQQETGAYGRIVIL